LDRIGDDLGGLLAFGPPVRPEQRLTVRLSGLTHEPPDVV
jgi:hypothetical protein